MGLSSDELAALIGTDGSQIRKLEAGKRRLTEDWMRRLAPALQCRPIDLIDVAAIADWANEAEPASIGLNGVAQAIASRGLSVYRVLSSTVTLAGIHPGDIITVDESDGAISSPPAGSIVLVEAGEDPTVLALRQFLPPGLLSTNRSGMNYSVQLADKLMALRIKGVVVRG